MSDRKTLRVAVSGIGWCGCEHIKAFQAHPDCEVVLLQGRDTERVRANLAQYGVAIPDVLITESFDEVVDDPAIDVVSMAGVNSTHVPYAVAAAAAGKHLMIEKPVARDEAELSTLLAAVEASGVKTVVSFELYWNPLFKVVRWLVESGRLGQVMFARADYHSRVGTFYSGWEWCRTREEGGSMLLNAGCHAVDAVRQFCNDEPLTVSAFHTTGLEQGYEYPTTIQLNIQFANGLLGQVSASADVASPYHFGLEVYGTELSAVNEYIRWTYDGHVSVDKLQRECPVPGVRFFLEPYGETYGQIRVECVLPNSVGVEHHPFAEEAASLVEAIRQDAESPLALNTAAITHRICYAADRSAANAGMPVAVAKETV